MAFTRKHGEWNRLLYERQAGNKFTAIGQKQNPKPGSLKKRKHGATQTGSYAVLTLQ